MSNPTTETQLNETKNETQSNETRVRPKRPRGQALYTSRREAPTGGFSTTGMARSIDRAQAHLTAVRLNDCSSARLARLQRARFWNQRRKKRSSKSLLLIC